VRARSDCRLWQKNKKDSHGTQESINGGTRHYEAQRLSSAAGTGGRSTPVTVCCIHRSAVMAPVHHRIRLTYMWSGFRENVASSQVSPPPPGT
jgi:hypothetical protein